MHLRLEKEVSKFLMLLGAKTTFTKVKSELHSHPYYPSLRSITDLFDKYKIENVPIQIGTHQFREMQVPFLAHLKSNGGEFVLVENLDNILCKIPDFFKRSSGIILTAVKANNILYLNDHSRKRLDQGVMVWTTGFICVLMCLLIFSAIQVSFYLYIELAILSLTGIFFSWLIVSREIGIENTFADQFCGEANTCNLVIKAKPIFFKSITWGDIGLIYFLSLLSSLLLATHSNSFNSLFDYVVLTSLSSIAFIIYSLFYQRIVVRKWCKLCLIINAILVLQFLAVMPFLLSKGMKIFANDHLWWTAWLVLTGFGWLSIKEMIRKSIMLKRSLIEYERFKYKPELFEILLENGRKVDTESWENELQLGNSFSPIQLTVACSPYCGPCATAHVFLAKLIKDHNVGLKLRFAVKNTELNREKRQAMEYLLAWTFYHKDISERNNMIHDWFSYMDLDKIKTKYPLINRNESPAKDLITRNDNWAKQAKVKFTPTVFINGKELPNGYKIEELDKILSLMESAGKQY